jgi:plasmid stabilization system protein ParE
VKLSLTRPAQRDIDRAVAFYARERPGLSAEFIEEVERVLAVLSTNPWLGQRLDDTYRRVLLRKFPYSLMYRLQAENNKNEKKLIRISAVCHQRRRPGFWHDRVEESGALYLAA